MSKIMLPSKTAGLTYTPCVVSLICPLNSVFPWVVGTACVPQPMFQGIRLEPALWSFCLDMSFAAKTWRWGTQCWRRRRGRNLTSSSPRIVILKMTNVLTVNQTCSSNFVQLPHLLTHTNTCNWYCFGEQGTNCEMLSTIVLLSLFHTLDLLTCLYCHVPEVNFLHSYFS